VAIVELIVVRLESTIQTVFSAKRVRTDEASRVVSSVSEQFCDGQEVIP
jgi:hypothetical protein